MSGGKRRSRADAKTPVPAPRRFTPEAEKPAGSSLRGFILGVVATLVLLTLGTVAAIELGLVPANADAKPGPIERWTAQTSLDRAIARGDSSEQPPKALGNGDLVAGIKLYAADCAFCHGTSDGKASVAVRGLYIPAPQLAADGVEDDPPGETFWKLKHGIRFTAMPAFGGRLTDAQLWKITAFLKTMDALPPPVEAEWKSLKSAAAEPVLETASPEPEPSATAGS